MFEPGQLIGDYEVLAGIGAGGVGRVYKARHTLTGRIEALKVLLPDHEENEQLAERFEREVKVQASLHHPNIVCIHNAFRFQKSLVMVMEFVEGRPLDQVLSGARLSLTESMDFALQALDALGYAHERGVFHRDIKPENLLITPEGALKITDFGIAKSVADARLTATGSLLGSLYYMSPEQVKGLATIDQRTDIYSLGAVLYEAVTGEQPFQGEQSYELMKAHVEQPPKPPVEIDPSIPPPLSDAILKALEKDPDERFASAEEFAREIETVRQSLQVDAPEAAGAAAAMVPFPRGESVTVAHGGANRKRLVLALLLLLGAVLTLALWQGQRFWPGAPDKVATAPAGEEPAEQPAAPGQEPPAEPLQNTPPRRAASDEPPAPLEKPSPLATKEPEAETAPPPKAPSSYFMPAQAQVQLKAPLGSDLREGTIVEALVVSAGVLAGDTIEIQVIKSKSSGTANKDSTLKFTFAGLRRDGRRIPISCDVIAFRNSRGEPGADEHSPYLKKSSSKMNKGFGASIGSAFGGIFGGGDNEAFGKIDQPGGFMKRAVAVELTARAPRIFFDAGSELDLALARLADN